MPEAPATAAVPEAPATEVVVPQPAPAFTPEPGVVYGTTENPWPVPDMSNAAPGEILNP